MKPHGEASQGERERRPKQATSTTSANKPANFPFKLPAGSPLWGHQHHQTLDFSLQSWPKYSLYLSLSSDRTSTPRPDNLPRLLLLRREMTTDR